MASVFFVADGAVVGPGYLLRDDLERGSIGEHLLPLFRCFSFNFKLIFI